MDNKDWFIIVNPSSGGGVSKAKLERISQYLKQNKILGNIYKTSLDKNAESLVGEAILKGFTRILCIGGDGTLHNLINGVYSQSAINPESIFVGVVPVGTGNDWARHYGLSRDYKKAIDVVARGDTKSQDIGVMRVLGKESQTVYFMNYAGVGFDGYVISKIDRYKFLGALSYLVAAVFSFIPFSNFGLSIAHNNKTLKTSAFMLGVGLCKYTGGGMRLAYNPVPNDGLLDITLAENFTKLDVIKVIPRLFNGSLFKSKKVSTSKTKEIRVKIIKGPYPPPALVAYTPGVDFKISGNNFYFFQ